MSYLDDSHFPGSQRVLIAGGFDIECLRGAFLQKHASSTVKGNGIMNTMTEARKYVGLLYTSIQQQRESLSSVKQYGPRGRLLLLAGIDAVLALLW